MHRFVRVFSGAVFSLGLLASVSFQASATGLVGAGGVLAEFDNNWAPNVIIANVRTFLRSVPVRF